MPVSPQASPTQLSSALIVFNRYYSRICNFIGEKTICRQSNGKRADETAAQPSVACTAFRMSRWRARASANGVSMAVARSWKDCISRSPAAAAIALARKFAGLKDVHLIASRDDRSAINVLAAVCLADNTVGGEDRVLERIIVSRNRRSALSPCFHAIPDGKVASTFPGIASVLRHGRAHRHDEDLAGIDPVRIADLVLVRPVERRPGDAAAPGIAGDAPQIVAALDDDCLHLR